MTRTTARAGSDRRGARGSGAGWGRGAARRAPILMYHSVGEVHPGGDPDGIRVSPGRFEEQMRCLKRAGLRGVSVGELMAAAPGEAQRGLVGLTFDDGYEDFLARAVPILESYGFGATVFALAGMLGGENLWDTVRGAGKGGRRRARDVPARLGLMDAEGLLECESRGMEVASHGLYHRRLPGLSDDGLFDEVVRSRRVLGRVLGREVGGFCYPYGAVDERVARIAREAGYRYAVSHKVRPEGSRIDLPRVYAGEGDGALKLGAKLALARHPGTLEVARAVSGLAAKRPRARRGSSSGGAAGGGRREALR